MTPVKKRSIDYLRFMPPRTRENRRSWWLAVLAAGPGWVLLGALKQAIGAFLAIYILGRVSPQTATEPVQQFIGAFSTAVPGWLALTLAVVLVVIDLPGVLPCHQRSRSCPGRVQ